MYKRKRRYRPRRYMRRRRMGKRTMVRRMSSIKKRLERRTEVKYKDWYSYDIPQYILTSVASSASLYSNQFVYSNILNIAQGTSNGQRIGQKIYVKFIKVRLWVRGCPSSSSYNVGDYQYRAIVSDTGNLRVASGVTVTGYFKPPVHRNIFGQIDRSYITPKFDRTYNVSAGWVTGGVDPDAVSGACRMIQFTVPMGRTVEYQGDTTAVKNDKDYLCLMLLAGTPGMSSATDGRQVTCTDMQIRVYYTDL